MLGLLWAIMTRFLKTGDDDDASLSPKDSLLRWVQLQTAGYAHVDVKGFGKTSFGDGLALCALMHRAKPGLVDYAALEPGAEHATHNLQTAMAAAEAYFGLEQYLKPGEIASLDEKSLVVYVSEYYTGCGRWLSRRANGEIS